MEISHESDMNEGQLSDLVARVRDAIRRRWLTLLLVAAAIFGISVVLVLLLTPQYQSVARIRIDPSRNPLANSPQAQSEALSPEALETEVSTLSSVAVATDVATRLRLENDPEFTKGIGESGAVLSLPDRRAAVANALLQKLSVGRDKLTYILNVKFTSRDSLKSARIANAFAESYISTKSGSKLGTAERQSEWFKRRLDAVGNEVRDADARVAQYRAQAGIVQGSTGGSGGGTITDQQVGPLSSQIATARSDAAAARANLAAAEGQISRGGQDAVSEVLSSPVIGDLRRQRTEILRNMGEVQARYGERHPESVRVRDQLASIDSQLKEETARVIGSLRATASAAEARSNSLSGSMNQLESQQATNTRNAVLAESLEREATAKRALFDRMSQMSLESTQTAQGSFAQAEIVDRALPPPSPTSPNKPLLFALALIVALGAGTGTIAVQEMLVTGLRTTEDVETQLGVPVLAAIPKVPKTTNPANLLLERPTSLFAESLRIARAAILGVRSAKPPQVIAITSALPSEGKTTTALSFARTLAVNNAKTLLIECDVRRAAMRFSVGTPATTAGIVEVLHGEAAVEQAITPGDVPGLDHLLVLAPYFSSEDLFGGGNFERLLAGLRQKYEHIVLDLPPLVGLADGRFLAVLADATALAVKWDSTPAAAASSAISWLRSDGANLVGVLYTMVDSSAEAIGGLYYSKKYSSYYQQA
ncbi:polysaccharide biosynthesis tyrosine autokinase [Sphingomonas sp.]|uniref:GumC family protein n=1 Tax=Sphingomonas sp. TaxID=28214 RepID=UPI002600F84D|nr:polysaccharide biosynthesis tyrosine autokinase [Sphingomonas sp.]